MIGLQSTGRTEGNLECCVKERHVELPNKCCDQRQQCLQKGARSSAEGHLPGLSGGGGGVS